MLSLTIIIKSFMYLYTKSVWKKTKSIAVFALMVDNSNDIWISSGAIIGFLGSNYGVSFLDALVTFFIGVWIIKVGVHIRVSRNISMYRAHTIEMNVKRAIEKLKEVDRAFVHLEPIIKSRPH